MSIIVIAAFLVAGKGSAQQNPNAAVIARQNAQTVAKVKNSDAIQKQAKAKNAEVARYGYGAAKK